MTKRSITVHGLSGCPFAWRVRIAARVKGVPYEWIAYDAVPLDPRAARDNPLKKSPLIVVDDLTLIESAVIAQYLNEAFAGPPLEPKDAKARARARISAVELGGLLVNPTKEVPLDAMAKVTPLLASLERQLDLLGDAPYLAGASPGIVDFTAWTGLASLAAKDVHPAAGSKSAAYFERGRTHDAYTSSSKPAWAT